MSIDLKISEGLAAGVSKDKIDFVLAAMKNNPDVAAKIQQLIAKFDMTAKQVSESTKLLEKEIAETDNVNSKQFSNGIKVKPKEVDTSKKIYPVSTQTKPVDLLENIKKENSKPLKVSLGSNIVSSNYNPYDIRPTTYNPPIQTKATKVLPNNPLSNDAGVFGGLAPNDDSFGFDRLKIFNNTAAEVQEESVEELTTSLFSKKINPANDVIPQKIYSPGPRQETFLLRNPTEESILRNSTQASAEKQSIYNNPLQGSFDFNAKVKKVAKPKKLRTTGNQRIPVTNIPIEAPIPAWLPKAAVTVQVHSIYTKVNTSANNLLGRPGQVGAAINSTYRTPKKSISTLGFKANLFSFDTETTGVDPSTAKIWQYGIAQKTLGSADKPLGYDVHSDPFNQTKRVSKKEYTKQLREMNGKFSEDALKNGNFDQLIKDYMAKRTITPESGVIKTLANIQLGSLLIMQNLNFENNLLRESYHRGELQQGVYSGIQNKMSTLSLVAEGSAQSDELFQRPFRVQELVREAEFTYTTQFMKNRNASSFTKYTDYLNKAFDEYDSIIKSTTSTSKVPVIELMDISKTFLANLAENNLIDKETARLGTNVDFLTRAFYGRKEAHTAASDSADTIELFEDMYRHTKDMKSGVLTDELKQLAEKIKSQQPDEVNRRFVSSIKSTLQDFIDKGVTKTRAGSGRFYSPEVRVLDNNTNSIKTLDEISVGVKSQKITNLETALFQQLEKYEESFVEDIGGFNRKGFVEDLLSSFNEETKNYSDVMTTLDSIKIPEIGATVESSKIKIVSAKQGVLQSSFNKNGKVLIGLGVVAGLAGMAISRPPKQEENNDRDLPVYSNFYDEQYLGTGFVEFRERNKRYVY